MAAKVMEEKMRSTLKNMSNKMFTALLPDNCAKDEVTNSEIKM